MKESIRWFLATFIAFSVAIPIPFSWLMGPLNILPQENAVLYAYENPPGRPGPTTTDDTVQNKAYAHLAVSSKNIALLEAAFTHPDNPTGEVLVEWSLFAWNEGSTTRVAIKRYVKVTGVNRVVVNKKLTVPVYDYYLLQCVNKTKNELGAWQQLFISESRWSRIAPYNGIWERTGEVTSSSAILQTYLTEKPAFNATEADTLRVPPMAGSAQFTVYLDPELQQMVSASGFIPVDDYVKVDDQWRRTNYNFRWTATDLAPDTTYYYILETQSSDGSSTYRAENINSFKTAPYIDSDTAVDFVVVNSLDVNNTAYPDDPAFQGLGLKVFSSMLTDPPPDFIIMLGDTVYYDGGKQYSPNVGQYDNYAKRWLYWYAQYQFPNTMAFYQQVPGYWMVDDHDYWVNNINTYKPDGWYIFRNVNPTPGDSGTTGSNAVGYYDNAYGTSSGNGEQFWRSVRWGKYLEIFIEEGRSHRNYDAGLIWGDEQRSWLEQQIRNSDAVFKIVVTSTTMIGPIVPDSTYPSIVPDKHASNYFRAETELFLNNIRDVANVFIVSGDLHYKFHSAINASNYPELSQFQEFGSGSAAAPPHAITGGVLDSDFAQMIFSDEEFGASAGYLRVEVAPTPDGIQLIFSHIRVTPDLDNDVVHQQVLMVPYE